MSTVGLALGVLTAVALSAWVVRVYLRRELPVRGRSLLAALRVAAILVVLLLLLDPSLPGASAGPGGAWVLLDASLSMGEGPGSPSERAVAALPGGEDARVIRFGESGGSSLTPALERAAESGADRVLVVSDLRLDDAPSAIAAARRLGMAVEVVDVGDTVRSAAVRRFLVPSAIEAGDAVPAEVELAATAAAAGDSATLEIREDERLVASRRVALPDAGRTTRLEIDLPVPGGTGAVRYVARVALDGEAWPSDDARVAWTDVDPEEGALVLLGLEPDWEPRFLLPVLGQVTGLRTRGFIRAGPDRWLLMDPGGGATILDDARVRREAGSAALLVVQGGGDAGAPWAWAAAGDAPRVLVLASDARDAQRVGVEVGPPVPGEWYVSPEVPSSPLAAELAGAPVEGLPPLGPLLPLRSEDGIVPLRVRRGAGGAEEAALVLRPEAGRRVAVTLAPGHWRWAFRPTGREAYRRLWSGVAGWLLAETTTAGPVLRPSTRVAVRGAPMEWLAAPAAGDTVRISMIALPADTMVMDTAVSVPEGGRFSTRPLPPGAYRWSAATEGGDAEGRLDVEAWTDELLHPPATGLEAAAPEPGTAARGRDSGTPLRTHPLPYLVILALLSAEWIGRRRRGLR